MKTHDWRSPLIIALMSIVLLSIACGTLPTTPTPTSVSETLATTVSLSAPGGSQQVTGTLKDRAGVPIAGAAIEFSATALDGAGLFAQYTLTGTVPAGMTQADVGFRVNTECDCTGTSEFTLYEATYVQGSETANRVPNSNFAKGLDGWGFWGTGAAVLVPSDQGQGQMLHVTASSSQSAAINSTRFPVSAGSAYTLTFSARVSPVSAGSGYFDIVFLNSSNEGTRKKIPLRAVTVPVGSTTTGNDGIFRSTLDQFPSGKFLLEARYSGDNRHLPAKASETITVPGNAQPVAGSILIFYNAQVVTMEPNMPSAQAIAIQGDKILAVGSNEEILALRGPATQVVDLGGLALLPGFVEGHSHILRRPDRQGRTMDEAMQVALSYGWTTVLEMTADRTYLDRLIQAEQQGQLRLRVNVFPEYNAGVLTQDGKPVYTKAWFPGNDPILETNRRLRIPGIKIFLDGAFVPSRGCWALRDPYPASFWADPDLGSSSCFNRERGDLYLTQTEVDQVTAQAQAAGFQVAYHAMGDEAIDMALNAIEYALDGKPNSEYRHTIHHNSLIRPDQLQRYTTLGVLASIIGYFNTCEQDVYQQYFGPDRYEWIANRYALPGLVGVHTFAGADFAWPKVPTDRTAINPMLTLYGIVTHRQLQEDGTACEPEDWIARYRISVEQALRMMTIEPAYAVSQEEVIGTLKADKFADLVVLSANPLAVDPDSIKDIKVLATMVAGRIEYCAPGQETKCPGFKTH